MKRSQAWFKSQTQQGVYTKGRSVVTMSTTSRSSYSVKSQQVRDLKRFVAGETLVGGEEVAGI
jgi:hypothetical protein